MRKMLKLENEEALLARCHAIEGFTFAQLAQALRISIPNHPLQRKGWVGQAMELALGTTAGNKSLPDFCALGIELKTLPLNHLGRAIESTFVTTIPLTTIHEQTWETSPCYLKLKRVLWMPVEGDQTIPFHHRRIGRALLWSPSLMDITLLAKDWNEFSLMISTGQLAEIDATMGQLLQVRPKAANGKSLCYGFDESGNKVLTLPRGFYLRSNYTTGIVTGYTDRACV